MRRRAATVSHPSVHDSSSSRMIPQAVYSHVSTYRSVQLELQLYSPSLKVDARGPIAVFNNHDEIGGKVVLDCPASDTGRLTLSIEGAFTYPSHWDGETYSEPRRNVFFTHSHIISVSNEGSSRFTFRDAFMKRRPSASHLRLSSPSVERSYPFQLPIPQGSHPGQELPPSFTSLDSKRGSSLVISSDISYKILATWEPDNLEMPPSYLEIPVILQHDPDFQSEDAHDDVWLEMPLITERPMPVRLAVALPKSVTFCRRSSIPYFVVFTTHPRSPAMTKEIAADSTISVALIRQIVINEPQSMMSITPPSSPSGEDGESSRHNFLRLVAKSGPRLISGRKRGYEEMQDKPLPDIPPSRTAFSESKTIYREIFVGFSKRPRRRCEDGKHPSLEEQTALPDGLHKSKISLDADMLPCIDWAGVSVKYYLDVSVSIGQDDWRARMPVRIF
ncbi:hypothetical protein FA15DRAFT_672858 [Coprinopsis marcescibilis]|uniref:Arrestin-like N-terminal domain-containing protein n=1 Tax=Coprinopsis marcescibilis TaxID=230819 RepID=A0A5C3KLL6_COPMA|nr:hypothetical protein FA15DRAFT_672858 [Coprinopsis marcescibilis]